MTESKTSLSTEPAKIDVLTIGGVAVGVYFLCSFVHEAVGHAGTAALLGAQVTKITTAYVTHQGASGSEARLIAAAGIVANLLVGGLAFLARHKWQRCDNDVAHYFLWLLGHMNLFTAGGYLMTFALMRVGDLNIVVRGLAYEMAIRITMLLVGLVITAWTFVYAGRTLVEFAGHSGDRIRRGVAMTLTPYLVGGSANVGASLLGIGEVPVAIVLMSAVGATFGGMFPLVWVPLMMPKSSDHLRVRTPGRSISWLIAGAVFLVLYLFLGHGISFATA
ncbi:MAG: hypothetical protein HKN47_26680 [Pirellulaceae bacterium]|nr:hypothetical protein [Pirellulaceae bacterium]